MVATKPRKPLSRATSKVSTTIRPCGAGASPATRVIVGCSDGIGLSDATASFAPLAGHAAVETSVDAGMDADAAIGCGAGVFDGVTGEPPHAPHMGTRRSTAGRNPMKLIQSD